MICVVANQILESNRKYYCGGEAIAEDLLGGQSTLKSFQSGGITYNVDEVMVHERGLSTPITQIHNY